MDNLYYKVKLYLEANGKTELNALATNATKELNNSVIRNTRKKSYGDIGEQLDEIYKDIDAWKARIKKIKDDNPKE
jgi:hypothetical protein